MNRLTLHALATLALVFAPAAMAQTISPLVLVDANGTVFGRVASYNVSGVTWASMDNGPVTAMLPFAGSGTSTGMDFDPGLSRVYFPSGDCSGTAYIVNPTPDSSPTTVSLDKKQKLVLYVADSTTVVQESYASYLANARCYKLTTPATMTGYRASAPPLPLRQYYAAPFSLR